MAKHKCNFDELERILLGLYEIIKGLDKKVDVIEYVIESRRDYCYSCKDEYQQE